MKEFITKNPRLSPFIFAMVILFIAELLNIAIIKFYLGGEFFEKYMIPHANPYSSLTLFWIVMFVVVTKIWFKVFSLNTKEEKYDYLMRMGVVFAGYFWVLSSLHFVGRWVPLQ